MTTTSRGRMLLLTVFALLLALSLAACGDDDDEDTTAATTEAAEAPASGEITIVAREYEFDNVPATVEAGKTTFALDNQGEEEHEMFLALINPGSTFEEAIEAEGKKGTTEDIGVIPPVPPGEESKKPLTAKLEPGHYGMLCFVEDPEGTPHFELGQKAEFDVE